MSKSKAEKGMETISKLFGEGVAEGMVIPPEFYRISMEHLFGDVWQGEELALQERSMITCAVLVALARESEQRVHFRGARNLGIPRDKLEALITHVSQYAGWPVALGAFRALEEVWTAMDAEAGG